MDLNSYTTTSLPAFSMSARASMPDGIRLNERKYEELISIRLNSDVSGNIDVLDDESDMMTMPQNKLVAAICLVGRVLAELSQHQLDFVITFKENC